MITTSSAVSTTYTTPSETSFLGGDGDNSSLQLSHEQSDRRADCQDDATGAREMGGKDGDGEGEQQSLGQGGNGMETAPTPLGSTDGDVEGNKRDGVCGGTSVDLLERNTTKRWDGHTRGVCTGTRNKVHVPSPVARRLCGTITVTEMAGRGMAVSVAFVHPAIK